MTQEKIEMIGHACAYTPLPLIHAAGYTPYRVLPVGDSPEGAGRLLHDNLCPHVKRVLDRALDGDFPELSGMVIMNCCDAMRRLADAWRKARPGDRVVLLDLPTTVDEAAVSYFASELSRFSDALQSWSGRSISEEDIDQGITHLNELGGLLDRLRERADRGTLNGGSSRMQELSNLAATEPVDRSLEILRQEIALPEAASDPSDGVPIHLFGNVLPDPQAFALFRSCGVHIVGDDLCTGSRALSPIEGVDSGDLMSRLAYGILAQPRCARTFDPERPGKLAEDVVARTRACNARGVIGHTMKFCDPYMARLPAVRDALRKEGLPLLLLEGDCTMGSMGQQRTRIEAFVEMLR